MNNKQTIRIKQISKQSNKKTINKQYRMTTTNIKEQTTNKQTTITTKEKTNNKQIRTNDNNNKQTNKQTKKQNTEH